MKILAENKSYIAYGRDGTSSQPLIMLKSKDGRLISPFERKIKNIKEDSFSYVAIFLNIRYGNPRDLFKDMLTYESPILKLLPKKYL